jgi:hypothetical protein
VAFNLWSLRRSLETAIVLRAQGYLVQFRAEPFGDGRESSAVLSAWTFAAEPRVALALTRHLLLDASAGVGFPLRGIVIRMKGAETSGMSGFVVSGSLGGVVWF